MAESPEDPMGEEPDNKDEGSGGGGEKGGRPGSKPQLRVYIPGQKEFVPRTVSLSIHPELSNCKKLCQYYYSLIG